MLILTRTPEELKDGIVIDGPARITVLSVSGKIVRLGIEAEPHVTIRRGELPPRESNNEAA